MAFFPLAKAALASLPTAHFAALRLHFLFQLAQFVLSFSLKPAPLCKFSADLGSTNKSAITLFFSSSCFIITIQSSPLYFLFPQTLWQIWKELFFYSSFTIRLQRILKHSFLQGNDGLARKGELFLPSAISCDLSSLTSRIHSSLFSDCRRIVSSKFLDTQVPSVSAEEPALPRHTRLFSLVFAATDAAFR